MTERIKDERLAEINQVWAEQAFLDNHCAFELLQGLKAEREEVIYWQEQSRLKNKAMETQSEHITELKKSEKHTRAVLKVAERDYKHQITELKKQIKLTTDLYFEGCDSDTFDDLMLELRQAQILEQK